MSAAQHYGKGAMRMMKNYTKGYSDVQAKVRDATSNDPWGPSGTQMNEIAQMTYNQNDFVEIMEMLDKRLNDKGKNWRHVFKALTVLDYCLHAGSENVVIYFKDNIYVIKTLKEFQYIDEYSKDQGANVRQKAKDITNLLMDENRLREERRSRASMRDRMIRGGGDTEEFDLDGERRQRSVSLGAGGSSSRGGGSSRRNRDDEELRKAIEASKKSYGEEQEKQGRLTAEQRDLEQAIKLSEEEEAKRKSAIEESNSRSLFDDNAQLAVPNAQNNPFPLIDASVQPQYTSIPLQFTSFNPYQQQLEQAAMQEAWMKQQQEWQAQQAAAQQQAQFEQMQQAQLQQQQMQQAEWMRQQQQQQQLLQMQQQQQLQQQQFLQQPQQPLITQPTGFGSNNPFAFGANTAAAASSPPPLPTSSNSMTPYASLSTPNLSTPSPTTPQPSTQSLSPSPGPPRVKVNDGEHSHLASLFANRDDGLDTFGNIGNLRYGHSQAGRLQHMQTGAGGHNPFAAMNQQRQQPQQTQNEQPFFSI